MEASKVNRRVIISEFFGPAEDLYEDQLGWDEYWKHESRSIVPSKIFQDTIVERGFNMSFYYVDNDTCYGIHREIEPVEIKILPRNRERPYIYWQLEPDTHKDCEVLLSFDNPKDIYNGVKINGKSLEEVLERSYILEVI